MANEWKAELDSLISEARIAKLQEYADTVRARRQTVFRSQVFGIFLVTAGLGFWIFQSGLTAEDRGALFNGVIALALVIWTFFQRKKPEIDTDVLDDLAGDRLPTRVVAAIRSEAHEVGPDPEIWVPMIAGVAVFVGVVVGLAS